MLRSCRLLILLLFVTAPAFGQTAVMSNDYWISYLPSTDNNAPIWLLASTNNEGTQVRVEYTEDGSVDQFIISPNNPKEYRIKVDLNSAFKDAMAKPSVSEKIEKRSVRVTSTHPITLQQFTEVGSNVSLSLPIPTGFLGRSYVILAYNDQPAGPNEIMDGSIVAGTLPKVAGEFLIIAAEDSTRIGIKLSGKTFGGREKDDSIAIMLGRGQTYWIKGLADSASNDLTGSRIESDRPIAVLGGAEAMMALDKVAQKDSWQFNDHISEYLHPVEQWGTEFVTPVLANKNGSTVDSLFGDLIRIVARDSTVISVNGVTQPAGLRWDFSRNSKPLHITSQSPVMVAQYDYFVHSNNTPSPPRTSNSMQILTPVHQWVRSAVFVVPIGYAQTYLYVTAHKDSIDKITVLLPGKTQPVSVAALKFNLAPIQTTDQYRTYTLLLGVRGQIRIQGPCVFQVMNHGTGDHYVGSATFSYAASVGSTFGRISNSDFLVDVDSLCGEFKLDIQDTASDGDGIADITLLVDPLRLYVSKNTKLTIAPHAVGAKSISATVSVLDGLSDAFGAVLSRSRAGKEKIVTLSYRAPKITVSESLRFENVRYGDTVTRELEVTNVNPFPITIDTVRLFRVTVPTPFSVSSIDPLPHVLAPGEKHRVTVAFLPNDTGTVHWDSIVIVSDCIAEPVRRVVGFGKVATIFANDEYFGILDVGKSKVESIAVRNLSPYIELTLTGFVMPAGEFGIDESEKSRFPITLARAGQPGDMTGINITYEPLSIGRDSAFIVWKTDVRPPYADSNRKEWSIVIGEAKLPRSVEKIKDAIGLVVSDGLLSIELRPSEFVSLLQVSDLLGKTYDIGSVSPASIRQLPSGVYFVRVETNQRTITQKLVK